MAEAAVDAFALFAVFAAQLDEGLTIEGVGGFDACVGEKARNGVVFGFDGLGSSMSEVSVSSSPRYVA